MTIIFLLWPFYTFPAQPFQSGFCSRLAPAFQHLFNILSQSDIPYGPEAPRPCSFTLCRPALAIGFKIGITVRMALLNTDPKP